MKIDLNEELKLKAPDLVKLIVVSGMFIIIILITVYLSIFIPRGISTAQYIRTFIAILGIIYFIRLIVKYLFYTVSITERGIDSHNIYGEDNLILWEEIVEVQRSRGLFNNYFLVISENQTKIAILGIFKNVQDYQGLIQFIKSRAPNLKSI